LAGRRTRFEGTRYLNGLKSSITTYLSPPREWEIVKDAGCALFDPVKGGRYEIFEQRPLDPRLVKYCAQDVSLLFKLETALLERMIAPVKSWQDRIVTESTQRVKLAYSPTFNGRGRHMALAPTAW
jgi:exonuclease 3'-5' domain-containing protein 1